MPDGIYFEIAKLGLSSIVGAVSALVIYDFKSRRENAAELRRLLLRIGRRLYREGSSFEIIDSQYDQIVDICTAYDKTIFTPWNRRRFKTLFYRLVSHDPVTVNRHCVGAYPDREEATAIVEEMLRFIGHPHASARKR